MWGQTLIFLRTGPEDVLIKLNATGLCMSDIRKCGALYIGMVCSSAGLQITHTQQTS